MPMSPFLSDPVFSFNSFLVSKKYLSVSDHYTATRFLSTRPKTIARLRAVSKLAQRSSSQVLYDQRIPLGRPIHFHFATDNGDDFFFGKKFVSYCDQNTHLNVELLCDSGDGFDAALDKVVDDYVDMRGEEIPENNNKNDGCVPEEVSIHQSKPPYISPQSGNNNLDKVVNCKSSVSPKKTVNNYLDKLDNGKKTGDGSDGNGLILGKFFERRSLACDHPSYNIIR